MQKLFDLLILNLILQSQLILENGVLLCIYCT